MNRSFKTQEEISSLLSLSLDERQELSDRSLRGLMLIKRKNGGVKWFLKYLCPRTHQKRSHPLGSYPEMGLHEARQKGMEVIRTEFESDPFELVTLSGNTLGGELGFLSAAEIGGRAEIPLNQDRGDSGNFGSGLSAVTSGGDGVGGASGVVGGNNALGSAIGVRVGGVASATDMGRAASSGTHIGGGLGAASSGMAPVPFGQIRPFVTLRQFVSDHYLPYIKVAKRSWTTDVSMLNNHILPMLGGYVMIDLKPFVVQEMVQSLSRKGLW